MTIPRFSWATALVAIVGTFGLVSLAHSDPTTETLPTPPRFSGSGQAPKPTPAAPTPPPADTPPVQVGTPVTAVSPFDARPFGYEKRRIKRTVPLSPAAGVAGRWDLLYALGEGTERRAVYFDWDEDFLYIAVEANALSETTFDLDAKGDGWFRGVDNLRITVTPATHDGDLPRVAAQRWDTVQNKERPVWAASPIPASAMKVVQGRTPTGSHVTLLALGRTELSGLVRKPGTRFGLRVEWGASSASPDPASYPAHALLGLELAESLEARGEGVEVQVRAAPRQIVPGETVRLSVEVANRGKTPARIRRLFLRGSQATQPLLDAATFTGQVLGPGETVKREFTSTVAAEALLGTHTVAGGVELADNTVLAALAAFDRLDPFAVSLELEDKPVRSGASQKRTVLVAVRSRSNRRVEGKVALILPPGWVLGKGDLKRNVSLGFAGDTKPVYYQVVVPASAPPGTYPIQAQIEVADRAYTAGGAIRVTQNVADPS